MKWWGRLLNSLKILLGILVCSKCPSSHCQERCSTSEMNSLESTAPPTRAGKLLTTSKGLQTPNWNPYSTTSSLAWIMFRAARGTNMLIDPSASQTTRALERKKGWIWREHSKVLWEFIKVLYLQNLQALYSNWRCLSTHPSCLKHNTQQILPKENTQWNSLTVTFGFWLRIVQ